MFRRTTTAKRTAQNLSNAESNKITGTPPTPDALDNVVKAADFDGESHPGNDNIVKDNGSDVASIADGSWICFNNFDFGVGAGGSIDVQAASANAGGTIEVHSGSATGTLLGTVTINKTWNWTDYEYFSANLSFVRGRKDLYFQRRKWQPVQF